MRDILVRRRLALEEERHAAGDYGGSADVRVQSLPSGTRYLRAPHDRGVQPEPAVVRLTTYQGLLTGHDVPRRIAPSLAGIDANDLTTEEEKRAQRRTLLDTEMTRVIEEALLDSTTRAAGIEVRRFDVMAAVEEQANRSGGMTALLDVLSDDGMDLEDLMEEIRVDLTKQNYVVWTGLTEASLRPPDPMAFYRENLDLFTEGARVRIQQMSLAVDDFEDPAAARVHARSVALQLRQGADFASVARQYAGGRKEPGEGAMPSDRIDGEAVWISLLPGCARPEIAEAAFSLPAGSISDPIDVAVGGRPMLYVVGVLESRPPRIRPYHEVRDEVAELARQRWWNSVVETAVGPLTSAARAVVDSMPGFEAAARSFSRAIETGDRAALERVLTADRGADVEAILRRTEGRPAEHSVEWKEMVVTSSMHNVEPRNGVTSSMHNVKPRNGVTAGRSPTIFRGRHRLVRTGAPIVEDLIEVERVEEEGRVRLRPLSLGEVFPR